MQQQKYTAKCLHDARELTPQELKQTLDQLGSLPQALQFVLDAELKAGNKISDVSIDYPDKGSVCVSMKSRFRSRYKVNGLAYNLTNDPHYWYADYCTQLSPRHLLVCSW